MALGTILTSDQVKKTGFKLLFRVDSSVKILFRLAVEAVALEISWLGIARL